MGIFAESVNDQNGNVADLISDRGWDCGAIGQVCGTWLASDIDTESGGRDTSMWDGEGSESGGTDREWACNGVRFRADVGGATDLEVESVVECFFEAGKGKGIGIDGDTVSIFDGVGTQIVEACDMVGMTMGVKDSVEFRDGGAKGLGTKIR